MTPFSPPSLSTCVFARDGLPPWVENPSRFLDQWCVSGMRSLHADAFVHSPISFARRGVFITAGALAFA